MSYRVAFNHHPARIGILGFSAGGHLASTASTHWSDRSERPDFSLLIYPVISLHDSLSKEARVSLDTPPTFLFHGVDDAVVPVGNSLAYARALADHKVPFELHAVEHGTRLWAGLFRLVAGLAARRRAMAARTGV